jgi:dihydroorotate dehydrogenase
MVLKHLAKLGLLQQKLPTHPCDVMGLSFPNPVGLAAGLDKNGIAIDAWRQLGFGFVEVGTVTPKPQLGNPKPRLFRLPEHEALINRFGFNNAGVDALIHNIEKSRSSGVLGINIGKNHFTDNDKAVDDYQFCMQRVYAYADYITVNISSPNTKDLRDLQHGELFKRLLSTLKESQQQLQSIHQKYVPLVVKISPDLPRDAIGELADVLLTTEIDAVCATNTSSNRAGVEDHARQIEQGGLSGAPIKALADNMVVALEMALQGKIPIIGVGGIMSAADADKRFASGASLVQLYTGFIYNGPKLIKDILTKLG